MVDLSLVQLGLLNGLDGAWHTSLPMLSDMHGAERSLSNLLPLRVDGGESFDDLKLHGALEAEHFLCLGIALSLRQSALIIHDRVQGEEAWLVAEVTGASLLLASFGLSRRV